MSLKINAQVFAPMGSILTPSTKDVSLAVNSALSASDRTKTNATNAPLRQKSNQSIFYNSKTKIISAVSNNALTNSTMTRIARLAYLAQANVHPALDPKSQIVYPALLANY